jgi:hypothetical protein
MDGVDLKNRVGYNLTDNWIVFRGRCGDEPPLLNKIMG